VVLEANISEAEICFTSPVIGSRTRIGCAAVPEATGLRARVPLIEVEARVEEPVTLREVAVVEPVKELLETRLVKVALLAVRF
jgi:hypothetical protein